MNWGSVSEFVAMGGYGGYVWGSFGVTALIFIVEIILAGKRRRAALAQLPRASR
jgi:heme exporter protein D